MQAPKKTGRALIEEINACRPPNGHLAFWWLGQLGYAIKVGTAVFYVDAYLTPDENRCEPPPLRPEDVTNADYIIASHDHLDHLDRRAWPAMAAASPNARFLVPALIAQKGHSVSREAAPGCAVQTLAQELGLPEARILGLRAEETVTLAGTGANALRITAMDCAHEFLSRDKDTGLCPAMGVAVSGFGARWYHTGDCCLFPGFAEKVGRCGPFNAVFLPINGRDAVRLKQGILGNITYQEAADLAAYLLGAGDPDLSCGRCSGAVCAVPGHYEMFDFNAVDPTLFVEYMRVKYPQIPVWTGAYGEKVML